MTASKPTEKPFSLPSKGNANAKQSSVSASNAACKG